MSRRKKHGDHGGGHERWLVSYADFITLLFAFFVVLFASSQVDEQKVGKLSKAIQTAFQEMGVFSTSSTRIPLDATEPMPFEEYQLTENIKRHAALGRLVPGMEGALNDFPRDADLAKLQRQLEKALAPEIQRREVGLKVHPKGVVISLREIGFFDSGSATIRSGSEATLARIAALLSPGPHHVRIEGHTDNVPIHTTQFASNWELSTARATEMIRLFVTRYSFAPNRLSAAGYAEFHPVATNDSLEERALNRRVDLIILARANEPQLVPGAEGTDTPTAIPDKGALEPHPPLLRNPAERHTLKPEPQHPIG